MLGPQRIAESMNLKWDGRVGPGAVVSLGGALLILAGLGVTWGNTVSKIDAAATLAAEAKAAAKEVSDGAVKRDQRLASQAERLGKIETSIQFIVPALQRIESKLDATRP